MKRVFVFVVVIVSIVLFMSSTNSCSDANVASWNISYDADQFRIYRRVVFYNGITDAYILTIEGYCSIDQGEDGILRVIVKTDDGSYVKHYLGLSDNVTYFAEQLVPAKVSSKRYRVLFKPIAIIPDIELK